MKQSLYDKILYSISGHGFVRVVILSVLIALCSWRPADFLQELQQKYEAYKEKYPLAKIHCILNQPVYAPGDTAFLQCWYMTETLGRVKGEHIITLDLFNGDGRVVQKLRFKVKNGVGRSQFVINSDATPGDYQIVGYTDWMRNFKPAGFFQKMIRVESTKQIETTLKKSETIKFFAEGGNFIGGAINNVVVMGPPSVVLQLKNPADSAVTMVSLDSTGFGRFTLTPEAGVRYFAEWPAGGRRWLVPPTVKDGISLVMTNNVPEFTLSVPENSQFIGKEIYAVVVAEGKIKFREGLVIKEDRTLRINIPLQATNSAVHELLLFDSTGKILSRRLFFLERATNITAKLNVSESVGQRGRISGAVRVLDDSGNSLEADVNVVVYQANLFGDNAGSTDFYLSEFPAAEERARRYAISDKSRLNEFLITQHRDIDDWQSILNNQPVSLKFPFYSEMKLRGKVVSRKNGEAPPDSTAIIGYLQANTVGYEAYTRGGNFEMTLIYDFWGPDKIFCTLKSKNKSINENYDIIVVNDSIDAVAAWTSVEKEQPSVYGRYASNRNIVSKSYSFFGEGESRAVDGHRSPNEEFEDEFRGVDYEVNVEQYMTFPSMAEFLQEAVPFVRYRKKGDKETVRMSYRYEKTLRVFQDDPLYIIDGLMTTNTSYFLSLKPEQLLYIKVLNNPNKLMQLGKLGENAVIFVESKKGDLYKPLESENIFSVTGLSQPREFFEYDHNDDRSDRIPDLRATLFWKPLIETKSGAAEFSFFASDDIGPVKIVVTGFTKDGRPFSAEKQINVVFDAEAR